jgi:calcineurin-like phosphoesterase family protein
MMYSKTLFHKMQRFLTIGFLVLVSCDNLIEYSPYQAGVNTGNQQRNIQIINQLTEEGKGEFQPFKIALIGDSHTYYDDLKDQIRILNQTDSIDFVVHLGDITLSGTHREFLWYGELIDGLNLPLITLIGNHDCLSSGDYIYYDMFGPSNFTLDYHGCRLVFFDNIVWERNVEDPDFKWLYNACDTDEAVHRLVFAHIPPWDEQLSIGNGFVYNKIMQDQNVSLSINGHSHSFSYGHRKEEEIPYDIPFLVIGDSKDREIVILEVLADTLLVNRKKF